MSALAHYRAAFATLEGRLPADQRGPRAAALDAFVQRGFPGKREEDWKYTDLATLGEQRFDVAGAATPGPLPSLAATRRLVFVNGRAPSDPGAAGAFTSPHPGFREPAAAQGGVALLNAAFATAGVDLSVPAGQRLPEPLHVVTWSGGCTSPCMTHLAHRIALGADSEATVIFHQLGDDSPHFETQRCDIEVGRNARLTLYRVQQQGAGTSSIGRIDATLQRDSRLTAVTADLGAGLARNDLGVTLAGPGAEVELHGLFCPRAAAHVDNHTRIDHVAPHCRSHEHFRGVMPDAARAVFNGKIVVHPGAQKTDSEQRIANLLLTPRAEVNAKPELEIYADDVKCAHGATTGRLDETAVFYLRSRGVPEPAARALLTYAFADEVIARIAHEGLRHSVQRAFLARLPEGGILGELS